MSPTEILEALSRLPPAERLEVLEAALRLTREEMAQGTALRRSGPLPASTEKPEQKMAQARERLYASLKEDEEEPAEPSFLQKIFRV